MISIKALQRTGHATDGSPSFNGFPPREPAAELNRSAGEVPMAEMVDDPILGPLTWDGDGGWYVGETNVTPGHTADLYLGVDEAAFW
ncbi:MAG TPA: hypothetical protein VG013_03395, partial [Gemmataceae bacterium]|nr:hypothetical protein [Gemmataceae bacterium]